MKTLRTRPSKQQNIFICITLYFISELWPIIHVETIKIHYCLIMIQGLYFKNSPIGSFIVEIKTIYKFDLLKVHFML